MLQKVYYDMILAQVSDVSDVFAKVLMDTTMSEFAAKFEGNDGQSSISGSIVERPQEDVIRI